MLELVRTIARQRIEALTVKYSEPDVVANNRLLAWETYLKTPMPTSLKEEWRRTDLTQLDLSALAVNDFGKVQHIGNLAHQDSQNLPAWFKLALSYLGQPAGILLQAPNNVGYVQLEESWADRGVIFCDLFTAVQNYPDLVGPYLATPLKSSQDGKFQLLNKALFDCGAFLYVPKGMEVSLPFILGIDFSLSSDNSNTYLGSAIFPRLIVVAEENSALTIAYILGSDTGVNPREKSLPQRSYLMAGISEVYVKDEACASYLELQQLHSDIFCVQHLSSQVAANGQCNVLSVALGGRQTKSDIATYLTKPGASSEVLGVVLGDGCAHFNFNTIQEHNAPDTKSNISFRTALKDGAASVYQGIIRVDKVAQRTDAYQSNKNLLLSPNAKADSIPKLEILADDVKCSHGATVGPVDQEQVFYLTSRGLTIGQAEELIVLGFLKQVFERFSLNEISHWLSDVISSKLSGITTKSFLVKQKALTKTK